jgi:site-specific recombinase XerD
MKPGGLVETKEDAAGGLLDVQHVDAFVRALREAGYSERSVRSRRPVAVSFVRWSQRKRLTVSKIDESHVTAFLGRVSGRSRTRDQAALERAAVRRFLRHIRGDGGADASRPWMKVGCASELERQYADYLRNERGLHLRGRFAYTRPSFGIC